MRWKLLLCLSFCLPLFSVLPLSEMARRIDRAQGREKLRLIMELFQYSKPQLAAPDLPFSLAAYARQALTISRRLQDRRAEALSLKHLAYSCYKERLYEKAMDYYFQSRLRFRQLADTANEAEANKEIGNLFFFVFFDYDRALEYFRKTLALYRKSGDRVAVAKSLNNIGEIYRVRGEYQEAISLYLQALPVFEKSRRYSDQGGVLCNLGDVYFKMGDRQEAFSYLQRALATYGKSGEKHRFGRVYSRLGLYYMEEGDFARALDYLQRARAISEAGLETLRLGGDLHNLGLLYSRFGPEKEAERYFQLALDQRHRLSDQAGAIQTMLAQGALLQKQGKLKPTEELLLSCEQQARKNRLYGELEEIFRQLSLLYERRNDAPRALKYQKEYLASRERLFGMPVIAGIQRLLSHYESAREMRQERERRRLLALLAGLSIAILLLVIALLVRKHKALRRSASGNLLLKEQLLREKKAQLAELQDKLHRFQEQQERGKYQGSHLDENKGYEYLLLLMKAMRPEKAYLDSELSLRKLAKRIGANTSYLSRILNEHVQMSFTDFVNFFRVEETMAILINDRKREWDLVDVCFEVGFNSMASFYRAFKRHTGLTPSEFQRRPRAEGRT